MENYGYIIHNFRDFHLPVTASIYNGTFCTISRTFTWFMIIACVQYKVLSCRPVSIRANPLGLSNGRPYHVPNAVIHRFVDNLDFSKHMWIALQHVGYRMYDMCFRIKQLTILSNYTPQKAWCPTKSQGFRSFDNYAINFFRTHNTFMVNYISSCENYRHAIYFLVLAHVV